MINLAFMAKGAQENGNLNKDISINLMKDFLISGLCQPLKRVRRFFSSFSFLFFEFDVG